MAVRGKRTFQVETSYCPDAATAKRCIEARRRGLLVDRIITRLGLADADPQLLHERRGTTVYKIDGIALKITTGLMAGREGDILRLLGAEFYRDHGWDEERSWLLLRWLDGATLWTALEPGHRGDDSLANKHHMLSMAAAAAHELADPDAERTGLLADIAAVRRSPATARPTAKELATSFSSCRLTNGGNQPTGTWRRTS